ncbi:uncharacterized protein RHOBADRAFT_40363 [Rhodotorula graminis WP1]|uniref:Quinate transporter n=1 Tax=Rhodotorula graminis (strain WP1) TaxID=578459 RepID=A0A0P9EPU5_RHOGW|nr:uncharacterized protein RHOBADRAFT_40363 [Rhodotorula graminis WP1]KPV71552.1 hypothetical protein RHOBADRAFT_40363 [Rhodotorula graminis WP1]
MGLKKVEDRPTPSAVYNLCVASSLASTAACPILIGYDSAFFGTSVALTSFKNEFGADNVASNSAWLVSCYQLGALAGSLLALPCAFYFGRRWGLLASALVFTLGAGIMLAADGERGFAPIYAGRVIAGLGIGAASNLTPLYISEIAPPAIRGQLVGMYEIGWQIGGLIGFWINYGVSEQLAVSHKQWLIPFAVQLIPGGLFAIGIPFFIKESPRWLISRGRRDEAIKNLCYLRKLEYNDPYLVQEVNDIDLQVENDRTAVGPGFFAPIRHLFSRGYLFRRMLTTAGLFCLQNGTGINAINYYSPTIFRSIGVTGGNTSLFTTGLFGVVKTVASLIWAFLLIDHLGRTKLLMIGSAGCSVSMFIVGGYIAIGKPQNKTTSSLDSGGVAAIFFLYLWTTFYAITWNGTPWVVNAEAFPGSVRQVTQCLAASSNWLWNFAIARATPTMFEQMGAGGYGVYIFFACFTVMSIPYVFFLLPETKNVPLEEMDRLFLDPHPWSANKRVLAALRRERADRADPNNKEELLFDPHASAQQKTQPRQDFVEDV